MGKCEGRIETEHQPGSGSWDPMLGAAVTKQWERVSVDTNFLYVFATKGAQDTSLGDILTYNLAVSYRLNSNDKHDHSSHSHSDEALEDRSHSAGAATDSHSRLFWDAVLELNGEWHDRNKIDSVTERNSGGTLVYVSPGIRMTTDHRWAAYVSVGFPVYERLNGEQHATQLRFILGAGIGF